MITYTDFETTLGKTLQPILVARYQDDALGVMDERMHVFFPDCHLLNRADAGQYPNYHFVQDELFLKAVQALKQLGEAFDDEVRFYHLGDLFDLWRASQKVNSEKVAGIGADFQGPMKLLRSQRPFGLQAVLLAGNHDFELRDLDGWKCPRYLLLDSPAPGGTTRLLMHGDVFDGIEKLPMGIRQLAVKLAKGHKGEAVDLDAGRKLSADPLMDTADRESPPVKQLGVTPAPGPVGPRYNVSGPAGHKFFGSVKTLAEELVQQGMDIRISVIGHTHHARIAAGTRADGKPIVLMDCGAWLGKCVLPGTATEVLSSQIGVARGNDLRIYRVATKV